MKELIKEFALSALMTPEEYKDYLLAKLDRVLKIPTPAESGRPQHYRPLNTVSAYPLACRLVREFGDDPKVYDFLTVAAQRDVANTRMDGNRILDLSDLADVMERHHSDRNNHTEAERFARLADALNSIGEQAFANSRASAQRNRRVLSSPAAQCG